MNEEKRMNGGYEIIESCQIGRTELVIGHNSKAPNPYVCWYCKDGSDYFWGYYFNQLSEARDKPAIRKGRLFSAMYVCRRF